MSAPQTKKDHKNLSFVKEVAKYFMDFLETDFHKQRNPKRSIQLKAPNNLLVGLNIRKYPTFNKEILRCINGGLKTLQFKVSKGQHTSEVPSSVIDLVKFWTDNITKKQLQDISKWMEEDFRKLVTMHTKDFSLACEKIFEHGKSVIKKEIVVPLVSNIEQNFNRLSLGDENTIYLIEEELSEILLESIRAPITDFLRSLFTQTQTEPSINNFTGLSLGETQSAILGFFSDLKISDLYVQLSEMERNKKLLQNQEFYLYFCDITFHKTKYPIFYLSFSIAKNGTSLTLNFDPKLYINKKALEYICQEYNLLKGTKGTLSTIKERIIYLSESREDPKQLLKSVLNEIADLFSLDSQVALDSGDKQKANSLLVKASNDSYIVVFDKSDESLVNDYEEILTLLTSGDENISNAFEILIDNFIRKNPTSFNQEIEEEWDQTKTTDQLVYASPIPLNAEQRRILSAVRKDNCKYITVEGPPGTGKSHTITAIVFNIILNNQSVLVLSDKKEALDVVEDKITDTLNKVRKDQNFQNPILRLGKTGNTYSQILSSTSLGSIKNFHNSVKKNYALLQKEIETTSQSLKTSLHSEIESYKVLKLKDILELLSLETYYGEHKFPFDLEELSTIQTLEFDKKIINIKVALEELNNKLITSDDPNFQEIKERLGFSVDNFETPWDLVRHLGKLLWLQQGMSGYRPGSKPLTSTLKIFRVLRSGDSERLSRFIHIYQMEKNGWFGYLFKRKKIRSIDEEFKIQFDLIGSFTPHENLQMLKELKDWLKFTETDSVIISRGKFDSWDTTTLLHQMALFDGSLHQCLKDTLSYAEDRLKIIDSFTANYPKTSELLGVGNFSFQTIIGRHDSLSRLSEEEVQQAVRFLFLKRTIHEQFNQKKSLDYLSEIKRIEEMITTQMTYLIDKRVIAFQENNKSDAKVLQNIIKEKKRFPREEFSMLKEAFPCILAGIRDYAEYIPLEPDLFDLVIIDEASQVSIAQAFPALLRAKKILILGDKKQFSNVKTSQARNETNNEYLSHLRGEYVSAFDDGEAGLIKLSKFNIKTSVLEFFEFISNFNTQLLKHFRGYKELISYSNKYFYQNSLQVMKIRGKTIDDVIKFHFVEHDEEELIQNTNLLEAEFIIRELNSLKEQESTASVGIITPHTNQQKLIDELIRKSENREYFEDVLRLKIMTFDTCQGEERDIIYYSMVATRLHDRLSYIFTKDLTKIDLEDDESKIRVQRLNVGFSRAKESMNFVLSKPIDTFTGAIGEALSHYKKALEEAKAEKSTSDTDPKSKMEPKVLNWFYQTAFYKNHKEQIEFMPQFELGKYLKQLDRYYEHPNYKVDFLLLYRPIPQKVIKIIIEYDGFQEHFRDLELVTRYNHSEYLSEDDIYRQKILESYGYRFIRINKFNVGTDPIGALDLRITSLIGQNHTPSVLIDDIQISFDGLQTGRFKECPKCKQIRDQRSFLDESLALGVGRICMYCKRN